MQSLPVRAYTDNMSYERGESVKVHVSAETPVDIRLMRLVSSDGNDSALDEPIEWAHAGRYPAASQTTSVGSFLWGAPTTRPADPIDQISIGAFIWSANFAAAPIQTLVSLHEGIALQLHDGRPTLVDAEGRATLAAPRLIDHEWHLVVASVADGVVTLTVEPKSNLRGLTASVQGEFPLGSFDVSGPITIAARNGAIRQLLEAGAHGTATEHYNGKLEQPFVLAAAVDAASISALTTGTLHPADLTPIACWDLSFRHGDDPAQARGVVAGQPDGLMVNGPGRGVSGTRFDGRRLHFNDVPDQYAAAHFHATDLLDSGWDITLEAALPEDLASGVYGVVVENEDGSDVVPITVVPRSADTRNKVAVVLPTFTYLAYANEALFAGIDPAAMSDKTLVLEEDDQKRYGDPTYGLSMYDTHLDGSGVMFSTARRQIVNMRRGYRMWLVDAGRAFSSDMYLIEWLARRGIEVDVLTDFEIHARGPEYLSSYAAVVSGSHPEYTSEEMLDTLTAYRDNGGGLLYLGGNGWYWVTGVLSAAPLAVEIRRGNSGIRSWESLPGEINLMSTGQPGGLWRHRGRPPQELSGVGFAAQGWGHSEPYYPNDAADDPAHAWIFEGVEENPIGAYGSVMDGAAGDEIDRADVSLGTPHHAAVVASSRGHSNYYQRVLEEVPMALFGHGGGEQDPEVHADIVYFATPGGGEVFSTGSIAWSGALLHNNSDNGVSRMTENVIRAFVARRS